MEKRELLYEGKAKRIYRTDSRDIVWVEYKDCATAFNGEKKAKLQEKEFEQSNYNLLFSKLT